MKKNLLNLTAALYGISCFMGAAVLAETYTGTNGGTLETNVTYDSNGNPTTVTTTKTSPSGKVSVEKNIRKDKDGYSAEKVIDASDKQVVIQASEDSLGIYGEGPVRKGSVKVDDNSVHIDKASTDYQDLSVYKNEDGTVTIHGYNGTHTVDPSQAPDNAPAIKNKPRKIAKQVGVSKKASQ